MFSPNGIQQNPEVPKAPQADLADDLIRALNLILGVEWRVVDRVRLRAWVAEKSEERREEILALLWDWDGMHRREAA